MMRKIALSMILISTLGSLSFCGKGKVDPELCRNECLKTNQAKGQACGADRECMREAVRSLNACYSSCD